MRKRLMRAAALAGAVVMAAGLSGRAQATSGTAADGAVTSEEKGHYLFCTGRSGDRSIVVDLYENSLYGSVVSVVVEGPDGEYGGGSSPSRLFDDGSVSAEVLMESPGEGGGTAGTAVIQGTYAASGEPERVHDVVREPSWVVVARGTRQQLSSSVSLTVFGETTPLSCESGFAYDLKVTRTPE
ncbi:hypothetical protein ACIQ6Y_32960 [Streptomyces sp. NPDC096205]|uniref:hypothetical protein n=1 Tax=Streptomyces sp. NPDC096205 TaxID=3366081 RepID=UPI003816C0AD